MVNKTIWVDSANIEIRGEGWGSRSDERGLEALRLHIRHPAGRDQPRQRHDRAVQIDATYRPDLFGKLDASAVPSPGQKWGIRTNGNSFVQFQASPLSAGAASAAGGFNSDYWTETSKLTVEFCIEPPDGQQFPAQHVR